MSSVITISQPPTIPRTDSTLPLPTSEATLVQLESDTDNEEAESDARASDSEAELCRPSEEDKEKARMDSLSKLESPTTTTVNPHLEDKGKQLASIGESKPAPTLRRRTKRKGPDAVIVLKEEKASYGMFSGI